MEESKNPLKRLLEAITKYNNLICQHVSIDPNKQNLLISSTGPITEGWEDNGKGYLLGYYEYDEAENYYKQLTSDSEGK